ncbi:protein ycf2 [Phtheirospermum japonicum]|uniref:Protein ycf2 n=1 Tax=Phtheirospermum japonicum TaxID=374723 RepID=A0A830C6B8_9LAMI|nr:protein ycf2 [Phtheirospermum japonicum]
MGQLFNQMILSMFLISSREQVGYFFAKLCSISYVAISLYEINFPKSFRNLKPKIQLG